VSSSSARNLTKVSEYRHLQPADRDAPTSPGVFFDPVDTEVGVWATVDLVEPGCTVLDLGSGSGAEAAAVGRAGAGHVHGVDVSVASVDWACGRYACEQAGRTVTFGVADYSRLTSAQLLEATPLARPPDVVTSNPPYVPMPASAGEARVSIDGGTDGLRLVRLVVDHAAAFGSALGLTIGSYSSLRVAATLLGEAGFGITSLTLSALRLGDYTVRNMERVLELEAAGEGPLLREDDGTVSYIVVGLSCRRLAEVRSGGPLAPDALLELVRLACTSSRATLQALDTPSFESPVPVRVVVLPDETRRLHC
jgi:release factor glutamine methyltransferase